MTLDKRVKDRLAKVSPKATPRQQTFLQDLLREIGFDTTLSRNLYLSRETEREIKFLDELTASEASRLIDELVERRDRG